MFRFLGKLILWLLAIVGAIVLVVGGGAGLLAWRLLPEKEPLPDALVLTVDLDRPLREGPGGGWLSGAGSDEIALRSLLDGLERAAGDPRVKALVARVRSPEMGLAQAQEVRNAVHAFRASGKPAYVFADSMPAAGGSGTLAYYMASAFGEIWVQPSGEVGLIGVAMDVPFVGAALEAWGITADVFARQEYKGALANLAEAEIPTPQAENMRRLVASWFDQIQADISAAREIPLEDLGRLIDRAPLQVEQARETGLIDRIGYADTFKEAVTEALGDHPAMPVVRYSERRDEVASDEARRIALIHGVGPVLPGGGEDTPDFGVADRLRAEDLADAVRAAVEDERVAAVVLRLDSPGGDYVAADTARRAVAQARARGTPVIVSMGNVVASGGYFIALEGDQVLASPGTITGSIGVASGKLVAQELWDDLGVSWARLAEGDNAAMWSINTPFSPSARRALNRRLDAVYADFTARVGRARDLSGAALDRAARGRVFTGADALEVGLVDRLGGLREAVDAAREAAALPGDESVVVAPYPPPLDPATRLLRMLESRGLPGMATALSGTSAAERRALLRLAVLLEPLLGRLEGLSGAKTQQQRLRYHGPTRP